MFKLSTKGAETRTLIFQTALQLFRKNGFDETTMRDVAKEAGLALGAAYYYFPSKEAIVADYYDYVQKEHQARCRDVLERTKDLKARLVAVVQAKLDILEGDRKLLVALFRYGADPEHPLSWFGEGTARHRATCMLLYARAIEQEDLPRDLLAVAPLALWALDMGLLLYFLFDKSAGHKRTRKLAEGAMGLVVQAQKVVRFPLLRPMRKRVIALLDEAGLIPDLRPQNHSKMAALAQKPIEVEHD